MGRSDAWLVSWLKDSITELKIWKRLLREDPNDLEAALAVAEEVRRLEGPEAALDASVAGSPTPAGMSLEGPFLPPVKQRLQTLLAASAVRLAGVSCPCPEATCPAHEHRIVTDLAAAPSLCAKHKQEWEARGAK